LKKLKKGIAVGALALKDSISRLSTIIMCEIKENHGWSFCVKRQYFAPVNNNNV
jgi:hypothetical protein